MTTDAQSLYRSSQIISKTPHGTVIAWEKIEPRTDTTEGRNRKRESIQSLVGMVGKERANTYKYHLKMEEYDCTQRTKRTLQFKFYDGTGANIQNVPEFQYTQGSKEFEGPPPPIKKNAKPEWFRPSSGSVGYAILKAVCGTSVTSDSSIQDSSDKDLYRNKQHNFEIRFPEGWVVSEGNRSQVVVEATNPERASINVVVVPYNGHDPTSAELTRMVKEGVSVTKKEYPAAVIIEKGLRYLSGKRGLYQKFRVTLTAQGYSVALVITSYTVFKNSRIYTITTTAPLNSYAEIEPLSRASLNSFTVRSKT